MLKAPEQKSLPKASRFGVDLKVWVGRKQLLQKHPAFQARQFSTNAIMNATAKGQRFFLTGINNKGFRLLKDSGVTVSWALSALWRSAFL